MRILITGSEGFIGSHMCDRWSRNKEKDNFIYKSDLKLGPQHDIRDASAMDSLFKEVQPDIVLHLAALAGVGSGEKYPQSYFETNIIGTYNVLSSANRYGVKKSIIFSSASVYGLKDVDGLASTSDLNPRGVYGASKLAMEDISKLFENVIIVRPFTVYGNRPRGDSVFGLWKRNKGTLEYNCSRGFTHVDDLIDAIEILIKKEDIPTSPIDISGEKINMNNIPRQSLPKDLTINYTPNHTSSSKSTIMRSMGWEPKRDIIKWLKETFKK